VSEISLEETLRNLGAAVLRVPSFAPKRRTHADRQV